MSAPADPRLRLKRRDDQRGKPDKGRAITHFWYQPVELDIPEHSRLDHLEPAPSIYQPEAPEAHAPCEIVEETPTSPEEPMTSLPLGDERGRLPILPQDELNVVPVRKDSSHRPLSSPSLSIKTHDSESSYSHRPSKRVRFNSASENHNLHSPIALSTSDMPLTIPSLPDDTINQSSMSSGPTLATHGSAPLTLLRQSSSAQGRVPKNPSRPVFRNKSGVAEKFFLVPGTENQWSKVILQHGGTMTGLSLAYYIIFPTTIPSHDHAPFFALLHGHQVALSTGWIQACVEGGYRADISPYTVRRPPCPTTPSLLETPSQEGTTHQSSGEPARAPTSLATVHTPVVPAPLVLTAPSTAWRRAAQRRMSPEDMVETAIPDETDLMDDVEDGESKSTKGISAPSQGDTAWSIKTWRNTRPSHVFEPQALPRRDSKVSPIDSQSGHESKRPHLSDMKIFKRTALTTVNYIDSVLDSLTGQRHTEVFKIPRRRLSDKLRKPSNEHVVRKRSRSSDFIHHDKEPPGSAKTDLSSEMFDGDLSDIESVDGSEVLSETSSILDGMGKGGDVLDGSSEVKVYGALSDTATILDGIKPSVKGRAVRRQPRKSRTITLQEAAKGRIDCKFWSYVSEDEDEDTVRIPTEEEVLGRPRLTRSGRKLG